MCLQLEFKWLVSSELYGTRYWDLKMELGVLFLKKKKELNVFFFVFQVAIQKFKDQDI